MIGLFSEIKDTANEKFADPEKGNEKETEKKAELPDDAGEVDYQSELPDDAGDGAVDFCDVPENTEQSNQQAPDATDVQEQDKKEIERLQSTPEGRQELLSQYPGFARRFEKDLNRINSEDTSDTTKRNLINGLKGALLEYAVKYVMEKAGLEVEPQQKIMEGESGGTKPDIVATNATDQPITVLGKDMGPGESVYVECKCGGADYLTSEAKEHIPNQLSAYKAQISFLIVTADYQAMGEISKKMLNETCKTCSAQLIVLDVTAAEAQNNIRRGIK